MIDTKHFDEMDMLLYAAVKHAGKNEIAEYNSADTSVKMSDDTEKRIVKLLHKEDRRIEREQKYIERHTTYYPIREILKRVAVVVLVVMSVGFAGTLSIEAVRVEIRNAVVAWFEEYLDIRFLKDETVIMTDTIMEYKEPEMGKEYTRYEMIKNEYKYYIEYESEDALVSYTQSPGNQYKILTSNEGTVICDIMMNEIQGIVTEYSVENISMTSIIWHDDEYAYILSSNLPQEKLFTIVESVK